jgi:outer membrane protein TolC
MKNITSILFVLVISTCGTYSQTKVEKLPVASLPSLQKVLDYAAQNSPLVKEQEAMSEHYGQTEKITQKLWMDKVFMDLGAQRANNGAVLNVNNNVSDTEFKSLSFQNQNSLRLGLTVRLSLYDGFARKNLMQQAQFRKIASEQHALYLRQEVKYRITDTYKDAQLAYKLLSIKADKKYALFIQKEMAEKEFQQGQIHISELSRVTELSSNAYGEFEQASSTYEKLYFQLEILLGVPLSNLK